MFYSVCGEKLRKLRKDGEKKIIGFVLVTMYAPASRDFIAYTAN